MNDSKNILPVLLLAGLTIAVGYALLSDPNCRKGCRTLGEHLVQHGLDELLGLF